MDFLTIMDNDGKSIENQQFPDDHDNIDNGVLCFLGDDDIQCGHVAYNALSHVLKFTCTYCERTYDNIEYFCQHLSEHINSLPTEEEEEEEEEEEDALVGTEEEKEDEEEEKDVEDNYDSENYRNFEGDSEKSNTKIWTDDDRKCIDYSSDYVNHNEYFSNYINTEMDQTNDDYSNPSEMVIEEIDNTTEIDVDVVTIPEGQGLTKENNIDLALVDNSCSLDLIQYSGDEDGDPKAFGYSSNNSNHGQSFEECFLKETNIERIRSEGVCVLKENTIGNKLKYRKKIKYQDMLRLRRKGKKVTTVKVIAVKNRIAELYEKIKSQQAKSKLLPSQKLVESLNSEFFEQETQDAMETISANNENELENLNEKTKKEENTKVTQKIIGETLITLIPEGTKIPNKLPSPLLISDGTKVPNKLPSAMNKDKLQENIKLPETTMRTIKTLNNNNTNVFQNSMSDKRAVCPACGKTFRSHFSLTIHKRIHYLESDSSVKLAHKCSDCDQLFNKLSQLKLHVEAVHYPDGFVCKICNRRLSSLCLLERHMIRVHLERPFNCQECGKNFSDSDTYDKHIASHNSGEIYKCHVCGRKYSTEFFLMEHMRNHKEQIPQTCVVCGKVTLRITQHMKIHTPRPKRLLSCSVCGKVFNFSSGLSHHFKIMHKLPRPPPKPKKEPNAQNVAQKRKRKPRLFAKNNNRKANNNNNNNNNNNSTNSPYDIKQDRDNAVVIIEEPSEIPEEVYEEEEEEEVAKNTLIKLQTDQREFITKSSNYPKVSEGLKKNSNPTLNVNHNHDDHDDSVTIIDVNDVNHKEEEAKRVIVELIQNSTYAATLFSENLASTLEVTPPIAREETISAVNSIVHDC